MIFLFKRKIRLHVIFLLLLKLLVLRPGDTSSTVSALCHTVSKSAQGSGPHALESGSDYKSRGAGPESRVVLGPGVAMATCDVTLVDDSEYELSEELQLLLSQPSDNARIGRVAVAQVVIDGPNDASAVTLGNDTFTYGEDAGILIVIYPNCMISERYTPKTAQTGTDSRFRLTQWGLVK